MNCCNRERREQVPQRGIRGGGWQKTRELQGMKFPGVGEEMKWKGESDLQASGYGCPSLNQGALLFAEAATRPSTFHA